MDVEPTCATAGSKSLYCTECGEVQLGSSVEIPADPDAHAIDEWTVDEPATLLNNGTRHGECVLCGTVVVEETTYQPDVYNSKAPAGKYADGTDFALRKTVGQIRGNRHFYPTEEDPDGNDLWFEYSFLWNDTLYNRDTPNNLAEIRLFGFRDTNNWSNYRGFYYLYLRDNNDPFHTSSDCPFMGHIDYSTYYPGCNPGEDCAPDLSSEGNTLNGRPIGQYKAGWATPITRDDSPYLWDSEYQTLGGWHRLGFRYHQEAAIEEGEVRYSGYTELYIDGVKVWKVLSNLHPTHKDSLVTKALLLWTAEIDPNDETKLVYADNDALLIEMRVDNVTSSSQSVYLAVDDPIWTCGDGFAFNAVRIENPAPKTIELDEGVEVSGALYFTGAYHDHVWSDEYTVDVAPTCVTNGYKSYYCIECGERNEASVVEIPATGHVWDDEYVVDVAPTCTTVGLKSYHCTICGVSDGNFVEIPATGYSVGLVYVSYGDGTCSVAGIGTCTDTNLIIPSVSPEGDAVVCIEGRAFYENTTLQFVRVPDSVTVIKSRAFEGCSNLASVDLGNGLQTIYDRSFYTNTSLTSVRIPGSVDRIGNAAFAACIQLSTVVFNEGLEAIGEYAFRDCALTEVVIPDSVTRIERNAFWRCSYLQTVVFGNNLREIDIQAFSGCYALTSVSFPAGSTWYVADTEGALEGSVVSVVDAGTNAKNLKSDSNYNLYWYRCHVWSNEYTIDVAPTCGTVGSKSYHCVDCDAIKPGSKTTIPVDPNAHVSSLLTDGSGHLCMYCGETVTGEYTYQPTERVFTSSSGRYDTDRVYFDDVRGNKHFYPTEADPEGNDLLIEFSLLWNETILNFQPSADPYIVGRFDGGKPIYYLSPVVGCPTSDAKVAGAFEWMGNFTTPISDAEVDTPASMIGSSSYYSDYPNIAGPDQDNPEWGWHRVGIRYHLELIAGRTGENLTDYVGITTLYVDGVALYKLSTGTNGMQTWATHLFTAADDGMGGVVYADANNFIIPIQINSAKAQAGTTVCFVYADLCVTCGKNFVQTVEKVANPEAAYYDTPDGDVLDAPIWYRLAD